MFFQQELTLDTDGHGHMQNLTKLLAELVRNCGVHRGLLNLFNRGSTGAVGTIEFEPGLEKDLPEQLDRLIPPSTEYHHENAWHDKNAHSHIQASLLGPSLTVPIYESAMAIGNYQQIIHLECDVKARQRTILVTIMGE